MFWHFPGYLGSDNDTWRTTPVSVIRSGDWKLMEFFEFGRLELYNLREDPGERNDLATQMPSKARELHARLVAWRKDVGAKLPTPNEKKTARTESEPPFHAVRCDGNYPGHLQGVCTNERDALYWSFTTVLVKTDAEGQVLKKIDVANHHGDLCFVDGKLYVAVNLGQFNQPAGRAKSWVYEYDAETLAELARHEAPEVVHGAGGIAYRDGRFFVVGGLPPGIDENYVYQYDGAFQFQKRHVLDSGYTLMGIQTAAFADGAFWFGCYGNPRMLLKTDANLKLAGKWPLDASLGIVAAADGKLLVARGSRAPGGGNGGALMWPSPTRSTDCGLSSDSSRSHRPRQLRLRAVFGRRRVLSFRRYVAGCWRPARHVFWRMQLSCNLNSW